MWHTLFGLLFDLSDSFSSLPWSLLPGPLWNSFLCHRRRVQSLLQFVDHATGLLSHFLSLYAFCLLPAVSLPPFFPTVTSLWDLTSALEFGGTDTVFFSTVLPVFCMGERNHLKNTGLAKSDFHHSYSGCSWLTWCELHHLGSYTSRQMISEIHLPTVQFCPLQSSPSLHSWGGSDCGEVRLGRLSATPQGISRGPPLWDTPFPLREGSWGLSGSISLGISWSQHT